MNANIDNKTDTLFEEWGERISAYLDNELDSAERAEVERLLETNAEAQRLADDFGRLGTLCREDATASFPNDLSRDVVAEALRRQATGQENAEEASGGDVEVRRLEPEGEFGLPFGKTSRGWAWAALAAAAALMIGFYGRTPARGPVGSVDQSVAAIQQAVPGLQVVNVETTADRWRQVYGQQLKPVADRELPVALASAKRSGLQLETGLPAREAQDQLLYLPGGYQQAKNLQDALSGTLHQVGPDHSATPAPQPARQAVPATRILVRGKPGEAPRVLIPQGQQPLAIKSGDGNRPIVLRVRIRAK